MESRILQSSFSCSFYSSINRHRFSSTASSWKPLSLNFPRTTTTATNATRIDRGDSCLVFGMDGEWTDEATARFSPEGYLARPSPLRNKLKLAFETGIHDTVGIDLVAMSVNDILTCGAKPRGFLHYFRCDRFDVDLAEMVIKGIRVGCKQSDCIFIEGETAEMPGFYPEGEYDLEGCAFGYVKKDSYIDGKNIVPGDVLIGLPSSGLHSNGFSLARRVLSQSGFTLKDDLPGGSSTLGEALMAPTLNYVKQVLDMISKGGVKGIAHITSGGFTDNIPLVLPNGLGAVIRTDAWEVPPLFNFIQKYANIEDSEMRKTFNLGIGMVIVVTPETALRILGEVDNGDYVAYRIGEVMSGEGVTYY